MKVAVPLGFYVYTLFDPRDGAVFYVGKGSGRRAWQHEAHVIKGKLSNPAKTARIKAILADGFRVGVSIVEEYDLESDAYEHEIELISTLAGLSNIRPGGEGPVFNLTPEQIAERTVARIKRIRERREFAAANAAGNKHAKETKRFMDDAARIGADQTEAALWLVQHKHLLTPKKITKRQSMKDLAAFRANKPN